MFKSESGITKFNIISILFEKLLCDTLSFQASSILSAFQHGFYKSRSTITDLLEFITFVNDGFIECKQTDVIYIDFNNTFDKVNHNLFVHKLSLLSFSSSLLIWIKSYLVNRQQFIKPRNTQSNFIDVLSGVPQGCLYADDVKIFLSLNTIEDQVLIQYNIN